MSELFSFIVVFSCDIPFLVNLEHVRFKSQISLYIFWFVFKVGFHLMTSYCLKFDGQITEV